MKAVVTLALAALAVVLASLMWWFASPGEEAHGPGTPASHGPVAREHPDAALREPDAASLPRTIQTDVAAPPVEPAERASEATAEAAFDWTVRVRAETDAGKPFMLWNSVVVATRDHPGRTTIDPPPRAHFVHDLGVWRPDEDVGWEGSLELLAPAPVHVSLVVGGTVTVTVVLQGGEEQVLLVVPELLLEQAKGSFVFQVVDAETGETPENGGFRVMPRGREPGRLRYGYGQIGTRWDDQPAGPYTLHLGGVWYAEQRIDFEVLPGQCTDLGVLELRGTVGIRGHVEDPAGRIVDVPVVARRGAEAETVGGVDLENFGEQFYLGSLPAGEVWVTVDAPEWACSPVRFVVDAGILEDAVVPARSGTPVRVERAASGRGRVRAQIRTVGGAVAWHGTLDIGERAALRLVPGTYTLLAEPGESRVFVVGAEPVALDV